MNFIYTLDHLLFSLGLLQHSRDVCRRTVNPTFPTALTRVKDRAEASRNLWASRNTAQEAMRIFKGCGTVEVRSQVGANIVDIASEIDFRFQTLLISVLRNKAVLDVAG